MDKLINCHINTIYSTQNIAFDSFISSIVSNTLLDKKILIITDDQFNRNAFYYKLFINYFNLSRTSLFNDRHFFKKQYFNELIKDQLDKKTKLINNLQFQIGENPDLNELKKDFNFDIIIFIGSHLLSERSIVQDLCHLNTSAFILITTRDFCDKSHSDIIDNISKGRDFFKLMQYSINSLYLKYDPLLSDFINITSIKYRRPLDPNDVFFKIHFDIDYYRFY